MEVDDLELLELVNDYQRRSDESTFNTLDDIPEALMIDALDESQYYNFTIEEFEGDDEEWEEYGGEIYGKEEE